MLTVLSREEKSKLSINLVKFDTTDSEIEISCSRQIAKQYPTWRDTKISEKIFDQYPKPEKA